MHKGHPKDDRNCHEMNCPQGLPIPEQTGQPMELCGFVHGEARAIATSKGTKITVYTNLCPANSFRLGLALALSALISLLAANLFFQRFVIKMKHP